MFEEHRWLDATFKIPRPVLIGKNSLPRVYNFRFENEALWRFVVQEIKKWRRGRLAFHCRHLGRAQTLPDGISGGHVSETEWLHQPNAVCCLTRIHTHSPKRTHTQTTQSTIQPTALSPHTFLPNISVMKYTVIYVPSGVCETWKWRARKLYGSLNRSSGVQYLDRYATLWEMRAWSCSAGSFAWANIRDRTEGSGEEAVARLENENTVKIKLTRGERDMKRRDGSWTNGGEEEEAKSSRAELKGVEHQ